MDNNLTGENLKTEIKVKGFEAQITRVSKDALFEKLKVVIELKKPVQDLHSFWVQIPAKEYKEDELITCVIKEAEKILEKYLEAIKQGENVL